jgi:hypothetical protein
VAVLLEDAHRQSAVQVVNVVNCLRRRVFAARTAGAGGARILKRHQHMVRLHARFGLRYGLKKVSLACSMR